MFRGAPHQAGQRARCERGHGEHRNRAGAIPVERHAIDKTNNRPMSFFLSLGTPTAQDDQSVTSRPAAHSRRSHSAGGQWLPDSLPVSAQERVCSRSKSISFLANPRCAARQERRRLRQGSVHRLNKLARAGTSGRRRRPHSESGSSSFDVRFHRHDGHFSLNDSALIPVSDGSGTENSTPTPLVIGHEVPAPYSQSRS
jgi:hypothetical protein